MKIILIFGFISLFSGFSAMVNAADIPSVVEGAEEYSKEQCEATAANDCIESLCQTSSDIDCEDKCRTTAVDKCKEMNE